MRRPPAPFAGDDLVDIGDTRHAAHDDRLENASLANRIGEVLQIGLGEHPAGIAGARAQELDRNLALPARAGQRLILAADIADQRRQVRVRAATVPNLPPSRKFLNNINILITRTRDSGRAQGPLALDDFRGEFQIGLRAAHLRSYSKAGLPCDGASDTRTLRGIMV